MATDTRPVPDASNGRQLPETVNSHARPKKDAHAATRRSENKGDASDSTDDSSAMQHSRSRDLETEPDRAHDTRHRDTPSPEADE